MPTETETTHQSDILTERTCCRTSRVDQDAFHLAGRSYRFGRGYVIRYRLDQVLEAPSTKCNTQKR